MWMAFTEARWVIPTTVILNTDVARQDASHYCRVCGDEEELKMTKHFLSQCTRCHIETKHDLC